MHNGASSVHESYVKDVLLHVDCEAERAMWNSNIVDGLDEMAIVTGTRGSGLYRRK